MRFQNVLTLDIDQLDTSVGFGLRTPVGAAS
jgi:hypothetical protein